jgi:AraC-like DNA-binding protein
MELSHYRTLGHSGLRVSPVTLGAMTFGNDWGWGASPEASKAVLAAYLQKGGNIIDTANIYTKGHSEKIIGDHIRETGIRRDRLVLSTKYSSSMHPADPNSGGTGRKGTIASLEASLRRLQTDYIDLYYADLIAKHPLGKKIKQYGFFSYSVAEVLQVSGKEREIIISIFRQIEEELNSSIDPVSDEILISYLELLLNYGDRFYSRQFLTRKVANNDLVVKVENLLTTWFEDGQTQQHGLPTVQLLSKQLHLSPDYLSDMLRAYTGQSTQQHIHNKLIEKARELLSNTTISTAEVAYALGFEHPQSFNKLFKQKTRLSPMEFRGTFK